METAVSPNLSQKPGTACAPSMVLARPCFWASRPRVGIGRWGPAEAGACGLQDIFLGGWFKGKDQNASSCSLYLCVPDAT